VRCRRGQLLDLVWYRSVLTDLYADRVVGIGRILARTAVSPGFAEQSRSNGSWTRRCRHLFLWGAFDPTFYVPARGQPKFDGSGGLAVRGARHRRVVCPSSVPPSRTASLTKNSLACIFPLGSDRSSSCGALTPRSVRGNDHDARRALERAVEACLAPCSEDVWVLPLALHASGRGA